MSNVSEAKFRLQSVLYDSSAVIVAAITGSSDDGDSIQDRS